MTLGTDGQLSTERRTEACAVALIQQHLSYILHHLSYILQVRRLEENHDALGAAAYERPLLRAELRRRAAVALGLAAPRDTPLPS